MTSVSDPDSIRSMDPDRNPDTGPGCSLLRAEGFSCSFCARKKTVNSISGWEFEKDTLYSHIFLSIDSSFTAEL
jgi:hypothetical protein